VTYHPADLLPGRTDIKQQQIATPARPLVGGPRLRAIEQRWRVIRATTTMIDPSVNDFLQIDVAHLLAMAHAASALQDASNAEAYRKASDTLRALMRAPA